MNAFDEIKKALEELRDKIGTAYDHGDNRLSNMAFWSVDLEMVLSTLESLQAEENRLRTIALDMQAGYREAMARAKAAEKALDSLCAWLLHRFGPNTPEGREASCRMSSRTALSAQVQDESDIIDCLTSGKPFVFDPATNFCHADDGGAPEHGIKYVPAAQVQDVAGSEGAKAITAERRRQIEKEGWSPDNDDKYTNGELLEAAVCYALHNGGELDDAPGAWPWSRDFWKPTTRQRDLEKAGALIAAELDRVIRAAAPVKQEG